MNAHRAPASTPPGARQVSPVDLLVAEACLDPRVQPRPVEDAVTALAALRAAMELHRRRALPAAPRCPELPPGQPRQVVFVLDEAAYLAGQSRTGKHSPETARLIDQILAVGRSTRIND
ncbi:hypothetical protein J5Y04_31260 [Kitasatospora sp. RG8]|uniref:hypothetical protein n=1 Tax=Kitasatospora sp. RG8 TaxID=2820815 RepID=UPI001AE0641F|nr:hypothetical protein [Kitasatospora sp. RG8]MBP0453987.1 hypothetical protein [Kitasatospora sp. RG8]